MTEPLFERPIQTVRAISEALTISRYTLNQACQHGLFGEDAYQSGKTWLIDTQGEYFRRWRDNYPKQARVKGRLTRQQRPSEESAELMSQPFCVEV